MTLTNDQIFSMRKKGVLDKKDKSSKGDWDKKIVKLCDKINSLDDFYTCSSCSGRVVVLIYDEKKKNDLYQFVSHDLISFDELKNVLLKIKSKRLIYFKQESCAIHVVCKNFVDAQKLLDVGIKKAGWKQSGMICSKRQFIVQLVSSGRHEFPIMNKGKILVSDDFLKLIVRESNSRLKKSWERIEKLIANAQQ